MERVKEVIRQYEVTYKKMQVNQSKKSKARYKKSSKESDWNHVTEANMVKGTIKRTIREEVIMTIKLLKPGKTAELLKYVQK